MIERPAKTPTVFSKHPADGPKRMTDESSGMPSALREVRRQGMPGRAFHQMIAYCC
jgi:hypothetical protein